MRENLQPVGVPDNIDYNAQHPKWLYQRVELPFSENYFSKRLNADFDYMLFGIIIAVPATLRGGDLYPPVGFQLRHYCRNKFLYEEPIVPELFSTPAELGYDPQQRPMIYYHRIDYLFMANEPLQIRIVPTLPLNPPWVDILCLGKNLRRRLYK